MALLAEIYSFRWLLVAVVAAAYAVSKYRAYQRLAAFKGPFGTGWSNIWHSSWILSKHSHLAYVDVNDKYGESGVGIGGVVLTTSGKIARVGPNDLVTSSPELLAQMNGVRSPYVRSYWYNRAVRIEPGKDNIFSELDEPRHQKRRAQVAAGYSGKENLNLESDIDARVEELIHLLSSKYLSNDAQSKSFDIGRKIQYFALDVISTIAFGEPFGNLPADEDLHGYIKSSREGMRVIQICVGLGLTQYFQWPPIARLLGPSEKDKSGFGRMLHTARGIIEERFTKSLGRSDMLSSFVRHGLSKEDVFTEGVLQILAGSDTTATALRSIMLYLITHPRVATRLRAEIDAAVSSGAAPASGIVSDECLKNMRYLQTVVREGLRMHPPITNVAPKKVPDGGDSIVIDAKTYHLPGGTNIGYNVWGVNRDTAIFGDDAEVFRPERWLIDGDDEASVRRLAELRRTTEMIFGYGKFQCLGKPVAWMEITKVLFEVRIRLP